MRLETLAHIHLLLNHFPTVAFLIGLALFVAGFSTVFVALGASASAFGTLIRAYADKLAIVAGVVIIVMGLHFLGITPINALMRTARIETAKPVGLWGAYLMGLAFAFGWTPCIGPVLGAILTASAVGATADRDRTTIRANLAGRRIGKISAEIIVAVKRD